MAMFGEAVRQGLRDVPRSKNSHFHDFASFRRVNPSGIPQMGPIRAQFWLPSVPLASWTLRNWRKTDRASWYRPHPALKNGDLSVIWTHVPRESVPNPRQSNALRG